MNSEIQIKPFYQSLFTGTHGTIKSEPEDFKVEELLDLRYFNPSKTTGRYRFYSLQKTGWNTESALRSITKELGIPMHKVFYSGLKDKNAVTKQFIQINQGDDFKRKYRIDEPDLSLIPLDLTNIPLHIGSHVGNRFRVRIRDPITLNLKPFYEDPIILSRGLMNLYGGQRFGNNGRNPVIGQFLLQGRKQDALMEYRKQHPQSHEIPTNLIRYYKNSFLSAVFNETLRLAHDKDIDLRRPEKGALYCAIDVHGNPNPSKIYRADEKNINRIIHLQNHHVIARVMDINMFSVSNSIYDPDSRIAQDSLHELQREVLSHYGLEHFDRPLLKSLEEPVYRTLTLYVMNFLIENHGKDLVLSFQLPKGSFATVLLDEIMKTTSSPLL